MSFDPTLPVDDSLAVAGELRNQFNALKALFDAQQTQITAQAAQMAQLAPLMPVLNRDANGQWTLTYSGPAQSTWQIWARYDGSPNWNMSGEMQTNQFPVSDEDMSPGGSWWQVKICGEDGDGNQSTAFSNIISFGPVPE